MIQNYIIVSIFLMFGFGRIKLLVFGKYASTKAKYSEEVAKSCLPLSRNLLSSIINKITLGDISIKI